MTFWKLSISAFIELTNKLRKTTQYSESTKNGCIERKNVNLLFCNFLESIQCIHRWVFSNHKCGKLI